MTPDEIAGPDEEFLDRLVAYDEALTAGGLPPPPDASLPPQLAERLQRAQACVRRLKRDRRPAEARAHPEASPFGAGGELAFDPAGGLTRLGRFQIVRELGRGGCGIVYLAQDTLLGRQVALKVPRLDALVTPELRRRFLREARTAADIDHPNVVAVHEVGEVGPFCYLVSAYCPGQTLGAWLTEQLGPVPIDVAAEIVATVAEAVDYVHSRGILHRDLKPANILMFSREPRASADVDVGCVKRSADAPAPERRGASALRLTHPTSALARGARLDSWVPKITDFGLAKWVAQQTGETRTGMVVGTPLYMAPEQAEGRTRDIGPATDVYALGVILYEMLTGRTPFQADSDLNVLKQIVAQEPVPLRRRRPQVARDLEAVCLKCLEKDPGRRYPTAASLAADLRRFLAGESTTARPAGLLARTGKQLRRHRTALAAAVLVLGGVLSLWGGWRWYEEEAARVRLQEVQAARRKQYVPSLLQAHQACDDRKLEQARELLNGLRPRPGEEDLRGFEWHHLWQLCQADPFPDLTGHQGAVYAVALSPDGKTLASGGEDQTIKLWDVATGRERATLGGHTVPVRSLAFAPRGDLLASCGHQQLGRPGEVKLWDMATGKEWASLASARSKGFTSLAFSPNGKTLAVGGGDQDQKLGFVQLWDVATGRVRCDLKGFPGDWVFSVAFAPDGRTLATGGTTGEIQLRDLETGQAQRSLKGDGPHVSSVTFSPDGKTLASGSWDGAVRLWDLTTFQSRALLKPDHFRLLAVAFAPDGNTLASGGDTGSLMLRDAVTGRARDTLLGDRKHIWSIAFAPDGRTFFAGTEESAIRRWWDPAGGSGRAALKGHTSEAWAVAFASDGCTLATAGNDDRVRLWDGATGQELTILQGHESLVSCVAFAPDGQLLASGDYDGVVRLWETGTWRERTRLEGHLGPIRCVAFAPDGRTLATGGHDFTVRLWDVATGAELAKLEGHRNSPRSVAFAPDGRTLASGSEDHTVRLWDVATRQMRLEWADTDQVWCLAFAPDGRTLATGNKQGIIRVWEAATGVERPSLSGHLQGVKSVAFTPDGKRLASGSDDQTIKLWDPEQGQGLLTLRGHGHWVNGVAFAPDGRTLASVSHDGAVRLWLAGPETAPPSLSPPGRD